MCRCEGVVVWVTACLTIAVNDVSEELSDRYSYVQLLVEDGPESAEPPILGSAANVEAQHGVHTI